ncbi:hypothetical protein JAK47_08745 [Stenotrophomonas maltophilia]|uniref:hypothetical protein n=1 Tax=Stenotrophomonas maltophilia TaxID=40324 RepID=UPI0021C848CF|nr:hypothetical protein [Stenotrophomonas maltophilia]MCU1054616.1 hypothetical protein [Stenotrophomonas maltophilia]
MDSEIVSAFINLVTQLIGSITGGILGIIGALIGAFIGGFVTYLVGQSAVKAQRERDARADSDQVRATLQAIAEELHALYEIHTGPTGGAHVIEAAMAGQPIEFHYPIYDRYFVVYESCASQIGKIPDANLRRQIVAVYAYLRAMVDTVKLNNDFMRQTEIAMLNHERNKDDPVFEPKLRREFEIHRQQMAEYAPVLKEAHRRAMGAYQDLRGGLECFAGCRGGAPT